MIPLSLFQSRTFCFSGVLWPPKNDLAKDSFVHHRSVLRDYWNCQTSARIYFGLITLDHDKDCCVYEEWVLSKGTLDKIWIWFLGHRRNVFNRCGLTLNPLSSWLDVSVQLPESLSTLLLQPEVFITSAVSRSRFWSERGPCRMAVS